MSELEESKELLASDNPLQSAVKEQTIHMTEAIEALVKVERSVDTTEIEKAVAEAEGLKESDYTAESWAAYQAALANARTALEAKESQEAVDNATAALNAGVFGCESGFLNIVGGNVVGFAVCGTRAHAYERIVHIQGSDFCRER